jgi:hypothetical protein
MNRVQTYKHFLGRSVKCTGVPYPWTYSFVCSVGLHSQGSLTVVKLGDMFIWSGPASKPTRAPVTLLYAHCCCQKHSGEKWSPSSTDFLAAKIANHMANAKASDLHSATCFSFTGQRTNYIYNIYIYSWGDNGPKSQIYPQTLWWTPLGKIWLALKLRLWHLCLTSRSFWDIFGYSVFCMKPKLPRASSCPNKNKGTPSIKYVLLGSVTSSSQKNIRLGVPSTWESLEKLEWSDSSWQCPREIWTQSDWSGTHGIKRLAFCLILQQARGG